MYIAGAHPGGGEGGGGRAGGLEYVLSVFRNKKQLFPIFTELKVLNFIEMMDILAMYTNNFIMERLTKISEEQNNVHIYIFVIV